MKNNKQLVRNVVMGSLALAAICLIMLDLSVFDGVIK